jgi:hypothetical protein
VLKNSPDSSVAETETSLLAALQSGQIDYLAIYRSDALEQHLKYIALPDQINLSNSALAADYAKVTINGSSLGMLTAKPIIYGLAIPSNAPDAALGEKFVGFVLSAQGQAIIRAAAAYVNAVGPAGGQARGLTELRWQNGTQRDSAGLSGTGFPDLGALTWATRNSRTPGGQNAGFTRRGMEK